VCPAILSYKPTGRRCVDNYQVLTLLFHGGSVITQNI
jgi:hypothetical protein